MPAVVSPRRERTAAHDGRCDRRDAHGVTLHTHGDADRAVGRPCGLLRGEELWQDAADDQRTGKAHDAERARRAMAKRAGIRRAPRVRRVPRCGPW